MSTSGGDDVLTILRRSPHHSLATAMGSLRRMEAHSTEDAQVRETVGIFKYIR